MAKQTNHYAASARRKNMLAHISSRLDTKGNGMHAAMETGKDLLLGVLGGGLLAALIGKPSFLVGLGITGIGHYAGNTLASTIGVGMMASGGIVSGAVNGVDGLDGAKERVMAFKQSMLERTYLDKIIKKKETVNGTVGELQYFDYGQMSGASDNPELYGMGALDEIEQSIADAGMARLQGMGNVGALTPELEGADPEYTDVSDYNF